MRRWRIEHDRDPMTHAGYHWNLHEIDTNDPHADPTFLGFGSFEMCLSAAVGLAEVYKRTGLKR